MLGTLVGEPVDMCGERIHFHKSRADVTFHINIVLLSCLSLYLLGEHSLFIYLDYLR
jgi:hypothetical protein